MPPFDDRAAGAAVEAVLSEPPFTGSGLGSVGVLRRLWQLLGRWWNDTLGDMYVDDPITFWLLLALLTAVAALLLWHLGSSLGSVYRSLRQGGELTPVAPVARTERGLDGAREALAEGRCRAAVELAWERVAAVLAAPAIETTAVTPRARARLWAERLGADGAAALAVLVRAHEAACYSSAATSTTSARAALAAAVGILGEGR